MIALLPPEAGVLKALIGPGSLEQVRGARDELAQRLELAKKAKEPTQQADFEALMADVKA